MLYNRVIQELKKNKQTKESGGHVGITVPFPRLSQHIPLIDKGMSIGILAGSGVGKCFGKGTKIRMFDCTLKNVEDIKEGDLVMGDDSLPRKVISTHNGIDNLYKIKQNKGIDYVVNSAHTLCFRNFRKRVIKKIRRTKDKYDYRGYEVYSKERSFRYKEASALDYFNSSKDFKGKWKGYKVPIDFQTQEIDFDPYLLGLWLGDGHSDTTTITNIDSEILQYCEKIAPKFNLIFAKNGSKYGWSFKAAKIFEYECGGKKQLFSSIKEAAERLNFRQDVLSLRCCKRPTLIKFKYDCRWIIKHNSFLVFLQKNNLINNKHIPDNFKYNNRNIRLKVLAGLIDSDGHNTKRGGYSFSLKSKKLASDLCFVARSLGYYCSYRDCIFKMKRKDGSLYECEGVKLGIYGNDLSEIPCLVKRKKITKKSTRVSDCLTTGINIEAVGLGEYFGFETDGNHKFLLEDNTVVHNSRFVRFMYIYTPYKFYKQTGYKVKVLYYPLEDNKEKVYRNCICNYLYEYHGILISPEELSSKKKPLPDFVLEKIEEAEEYFSDFESIVEFVDGATTPKAIYEIARKHALKTGKYENGKYESDTHTIIIIDNLSNLDIDPEDGVNSEREAMIKLAKDYVRQRMVNILNFTVVQVLQMDFASERQQYSHSGMTIISKLEPSLAGIGEAKVISRFMHLIIGLFDPSRFELTQYPIPSKHDPENCYRIDILGSKFRALKVLKNNDGEAGLRIGLLFNAPNEVWEELPPPKTVELKDIYVSLTKNIKKNLDSNENRLTFVPDEDTEPTPF